MMTYLKHQRYTMKANKGDIIILTLKRSRLHIRKHDKWTISMRNPGLKVVGSWTKNNV